MVVVISAVGIVSLEISFGRLLLEDMKTLQELVTLATKELGTRAFCACDDCGRKQGLDDFKRLFGRTVVFAEVI